MKEPEQAAWQTKARAALGSYFRRRSLTPFTLGFLLTLTGLCGFFISYGLLHLGVETMAIRYPAAVLGAYGAFLGMLRGWVEWERRRFDPADAEFQEAVRRACPVHSTGGGGCPPSSSSGKWLDWLDWLSSPADLIPDSAEGCLPALCLLVFFGLLLVVIVNILNAPALMAEGFLDTFLVVGLYRRLRIAAREHWLSITLRKTWKTVFILAAALAFAGACLQYNAPEARSIGPAIRHLLHPNP
ncbi:MAG: hypothetical protein PHQ12_02825 [Chthoniobacteraceae bacterium]|nr:hypothetical protein [Chthoniobacteraceae bacterium]